MQDTWHNVRIRLGRVATELESWTRSRPGILGSPFSAVSQNHLPRLGQPEQHGLSRRASAPVGDTATQVLCIRIGNPERCRASGHRWRITQPCCLDLETILWSKAKLLNGQRRRDTLMVSKATRRRSIHTRPENASKSVPTTVLCSVQWP